MDELPKCKRITNCMICGKPIKKGDECDATRRGTVCKSCYTTISGEVGNMLGTMFPEDECKCPYCNGTGRVNKLKAGGL